MRSRMTTNGFDPGGGFKPRLTALWREVGVTPMEIDDEACYLVYRTRGHDYVLSINASGLIATSSRYGYALVPPDVERLVEIMNDRVENGGWKIRQRRRDGKFQVVEWVEIDPGFGLSAAALRDGCAALARSMAEFDDQTDRLGL